MRSACLAIGWRSRIEARQLALDIEVAAAERGSPAVPVGRPQSTERGHGR